MIKETMVGLFDWVKATSEALATFGPIMGKVVGGQIASIETRLRSIEDRLHALDGKQTEEQQSEAAEKALELVTTPSAATETPSPQPPQSPK
jgi:Na+/glutamate symporter